MKNIIKLFLALLLGVSYSTNAYARTVQHSTQAFRKPNSFNLELIYFEGRVVGSTHVITWGTSIESELKAYHLEQLQGSNWVIIGSVAPYNTSANYEWRVYHPQAGTNFYRLRIDDADANTHYSQTISVGTDNRGSGRVRPTVVTDWVTLDIERTEAISSVDILDFQGRVINVPIEGNRLNLSALPHGTYILRVQENGSFWTQKIMVLSQF